jgi:hypothetical protein
VLRQVFSWLGQHGLSVYGANIDPETGEADGGCRDYGLDDAIKVAKLIDENGVWDGRDNEA